MAAILADNIFNCIFLNENYRIQIQISLKYVLKSPIYNKPVLVQVMLGAKQATSHYLDQFIDAYICSTWGFKHMEFTLTLCGLVTPYGNIDLGQHRLK